jgi:hypothetical protein
MAEFEDDNFEFPDEKKETTVTVQPDNEVEVEVVDDTPPQDRGRKPLDREANLAPRLPLKRLCAYRSTRFHLPILAS